MDTKNIETYTKVVTRFAPSPTGLMHVGGVRTALFAYLYAKKNNGTFILRIEDTDKEREVVGAIDQIKKSLRYILQNPDNPKTFPTEVDLIDENLNPWDEFYIQSSRLDIYLDWVKKLVETGYAYFDPYSKEDLESFRQKAQDTKIAFLFRNYRPEIIDTDWDSNVITDGDNITFKKPIRFKTSAVSRTFWRDEVRGNLEAGPEALDDFILMKTDGYPTYNLCHIIDDIDTGVTHIMRGEEFIPSTPKFIALYKALQEVFPEKNITIPKFVTLPPILGETGTKKLSKRDGAKDVLDYHKEGFIPEALANFLAFQGWNPGGQKEIYTTKDLVESFSLERIQKSGARWNPTKLEWFNREYMNSIDMYTNSILVNEFEKYLPKELLLLINNNTPSRERGVTKRTESFFTLYDKYIERISHLRQLQEEPFVTELTSLTSALDINLELIYDTLDREETYSILKELLTKLSSLEESEWETSYLKTNLSDMIEASGTKQVLWPLRTSLSGLKKSVDPFSLLTILGKKESLFRINAVLKKMQV